jgi:hypothetical protein
MKVVDHLFAFAIGIAGIVMVGPGAARAATVEIPAAKDNTLFAPMADTLASNGAGPYFFVGVNSQNNTRRSLLAFAVADSLPAGATVDSVELRLHLSQAQDTSPFPHTLHRVLADWGEGTSSSAGGQGASPTPGDATWLHRFFPDLLWASAGGDFSVAASATRAVGGAGFYSWTGPSLIADVQAWLDQPSTNFGWLLHGDETATSTARRFDSRENTTAANRPVLIVHFTAGVPVRAVTWGAIKANY